MLPPMPTEKLSSIFTFMCRSVVDGVRDDFGYHIVGQQAEVASFQVFQREDFVVFVVKLLTDVHLLLFVGSGDVDVAEEERRELHLVCFSLLVQAVE